MLRLFAAVAMTLCCEVLFFEEAIAASDVVERIDRSITKEPAYQSEPKYCLMAIGDRGDVTVWMVEDGTRLYIDKNANRDLTDDGPPLEPSNLRHLDSERWDFEYLLDAITPTDGSQHTEFVLNRWSYEKGEENYGLLLSVNGEMPMYAGWFGTFWGPTPEKAPVIHFGGPFTPKLLRRKEFTVGEQKQRLSLCFINPGSGDGAVSRLSIAALPESVVPRVSIEWPTKGNGPPLRTSHALDHRCCYWEFYTTEFEAPKGAVIGEAKVMIELPQEAEFIKLTTKEIAAPVVRLK